MAVPSSPGFSNSGPVTWDSVRSALGVSGAQNINSLMTHANIKKYSFYRPGGIAISSQTIVNVPDTAPYKWGDWRNYYNLNGLEPDVDTAITYSYLPSATSLNMQLPVFWQYLNVKQLSTSITHVMYEVWTSSAKTGFVGRAIDTISWINETTIPDHSTTQTQRPAPGGTVPQILSLTINPQVYQSQSPLYGECWMTNLGQTRIAHFDTWQTTITLDPLALPIINGDTISSGDLPSGNAPSGNPWSSTGSYLALATSSGVAPCSAGSIQVNAGTSYNFYWALILRDTFGQAWSVPVTSIELRLRRNDSAFDQSIGTKSNSDPATVVNVSGTLSSGSFAYDDIWVLDYTPGSITYGNTNISTSC